MDGKRTFDSIRLRNFLSFGPKPANIELEPLNVLIGQNASGKSNFIEAIKLIRAMSGPFAGTLFEGGGVREYLYKGATIVPAEIEANVRDFENDDFLRHSVIFRDEGQRVNVTQEKISSLLTLEKPALPTFYYENERGHQSLMGRYKTIKHISRPNSDAVDIEPGEAWSTIPLNTQIDSSNSIVAQRNDPDIYPPLASLSSIYRAIRIYAEFDLSGPNSLRIAQRPDLPNDYLEESGRNLSMMLSILDHKGKLDDVVDKLKVVNDDIERITINIGGGTVQAFIHEKGLSAPIPAGRLSSGTLRYLCLLTILLHPEPQPLICIEEPETGLHPDVISSVAELLVSASQNTQLIVTTHSEMLVSALSSVPEAIVVCERGPDGSTLKRLEPDDLKLWLQKYSLGELWLKGELGGTRW